MGCRPQIVQFLPVLAAALVAACDQDQQAGRASVDKIASMTTPERPSCGQDGLLHPEGFCTYRDRIDAITSREATLPLNSLVGIYAYGNGFQGLGLALDSDGWAGVHEWSDVGSPPAISGRYSVRDGVLVVELEHALHYEPSVKQLRYYPLYWSERMFLLNADELGEVVSILDSDGLDSEIFLTMREKLERVRAHDKPLCGAPDVPPEWRAYLHPVPLHVALAAVRADPKVAGRPQGYRVEFAAGRRQGLFVGMSLQGTSPHPRVWAKVERVEEDHASGRLWHEAWDAVHVEKGTELVSGKGWSEIECVPPR